ncbi:DUF2213 domain-containing protein [Lichenicoccus roseus]|uniref:DUF2213 domain-containing protein n=1 Tax=Lichenicoccus roseus TaxID=2683649 RepID=A0A5R9IYN2_9PROT|nr:DUF2213 domain-containing protein [Lichenicoccus roseus]TLU70585.1 DUF2213 domain-containing protein [Lichenicoccus roseus]
MTDPHYREDFLPLRAAIDPDTGYLRDHPVLTRVGVFDYRNPTTGQIEREFRPASVVFDPAHLKALRGTPIVISHAAGLISAENARGATVGTIISEGRQDGDNLVAEILLHDPSPVTRDGMRELSLGYTVDTDDTPGTHNGQRFDRSITRIKHVNHLAIVRKGRAGVARLNMDHNDTIRTDEVRDFNSAAAARVRMIQGVRADAAMAAAPRMDESQRRVEQNSRGVSQSMSAAEGRRRMIMRQDGHCFDGDDQQRADAASAGSSAAAARARLNNR